MLNKREIKSSMKKIILLFFVSFILIASSPQKHLPIHINLMNVDYAKLTPINSDFFNTHLKFHLLFLDSKESNCKLYKKIFYHKKYDYWIILKDQPTSTSLILFQIDKQNQFITNHKVISEINDIDGASCFSRGILYDNYFEIITMCKNQLYQNSKKQIISEQDTVSLKYNYQFEVIN